MFRHSTRSRFGHSWLLLSGAFALSCAYGKTINNFYDTPSESDAGHGSGGASPASGGGSTSVAGGGGAVSSGGVTGASGGGTGGDSSDGSAGASAGGTVSSGGASSTGGNGSASGGTSATGGAVATGGVTSTGGVTAAGGSSGGPTCTDGVQNGGETGVDCGGTCFECAWGHWAFDETNGTTAADSSGNGRNGTLGGLAASPWGAGQLGGALSFNGAGFVGVGTDAAPNAGITLTAWVYATSAAPGVGRIVVSKRDNNQSNRAEFQLHQVMNQNQMAFSFNVAGTWYLWTTTAFNLAATTWTHVAVTYASGSAPIFYKNGASTGAGQTYGTGTPARPTNTAETRVGGAVLAAESPWDGKLDDVRIYARVLTASEITGVMNGG